MQQQSTAALALRAAFVLLQSAVVVACGVLIDYLAGTGPYGTLGALIIGVIFGTIMICVIILSSFSSSQPSSEDGDAMAVDESEVKSGA